MSVEAPVPVAASAPEMAGNEPTAMLHDNQPTQACLDHPDNHVQPDVKSAHVLADYAVSHQSPKHIGLHSPPDSNNAMKLDGSDDDSELSDVEDPTLDPDQIPFLHAQSTPQKTPEDTPQEEEEDIGEVTPDHWSGTVPVFKPDMSQFKDFKKFMEKIDSYGMKSGIVKIIPPQEWKDKLPALDNLVKQIRVREPIKQEIMGSSGTYRQVNILHQRAYNLPQWRQLCDQSEHQPPARRGERRAQAPPKSKAVSAPTSSNARRRGPVTDVGAGRSTRSKTKKGGAKGGIADSEDRPMTPVSPRPEAVIESVEQEIGDEIDNDDPVLPTVGRMGGSRQAKPKEQSTSARRKFARREGSARIDEEAFKDFDYQMDISDYTPERCEELERIYWKTLTYAPPLYGADVLGTLFDDSTEEWNLNKLPNLLDVLGTKVPGVNTAYLYLGMWKATFAWHLEDVDLYSINYLHFGAPKQWYSISQGDARRFEAAMKNIWPTDAKACSQFLRHKAFLISPNHLQQNFNIKVNKCVSYPGEFVVTYPYGYHSGYNLGYNCAEAVNFALDSWLPMGKIAKKCECAQAQDSVWVDVYEIERKLRGEDTEYEETEDEDEEDDEEDDDDELENTSRPGHAIKFIAPGRKRKRATNDKGEKKVKKIRLRLKSQVEPPCCLCPHDIPGIELLPTDNDRKAHRLCALYGAETWIETVDGKEVVANVANISKARLDLKCLFCRSKRGTCFQCSHKKCARSYHATCAAAAGVFVEEAEVPIFGEDGTEYKEQAFEFTCRFHRTKRDRKLDGNVLDDCQKTRRAASALKKGDICQLQYHRGEIFAGIIIENRDSEQTFLLDIIPNGDRVEVEWKWLLLPDPADFHLPQASQKAIPMPTSRKAKELINATRKRIEEPPRPEEPFVEGGFTWAEFNHHDLERNPVQARVDLSKDNQVWHYLGRYSTDARPQYTEDPQKKKHNPKSNFLDTIPRPAPPPPMPRKSYGSTFSIHTPTPITKAEKPYQYKPRDPVPPTYVRSPFTAHQFVPKPSPYTAHHFEPKPSNATTFVHHTPPNAGPQNYATPPQSASMHSPYYKFQHSSYMAPRQQAQRAIQPPQAQPATPASQQRPQHAAQKHQHYSTFQINKPSQQPQKPQQATPQPTPYFATYSADPARQSQPPAPQSTTTPASQAGANAICATDASTQQQFVPRRPSIPRPTPAHNGPGHTRNKSSVSSYGGRRALGSGQRFGTPPASYGHARGDSLTKSPFSHGFTQPPGLGPSPSPQNGRLFQNQARARSSSLVSNLSLNTPMTSSAIRPSSSASMQALTGQLQSAVSPKEPRPSVIQKYAFFQVHHNRDSTKYRTPYAHWGGFTNGYEGSLRAHLMRSPDALYNIPRQSLGLNGVSPGVSSTLQKVAAGVLPPASSSSDSALQSQSPPAPNNPTQQTIPFVSPAVPLASFAGLQSAPPPSCQDARIDNPSNWPSGMPNRWDDNLSTGATLHPAIRTHYAAMLSNRNVKMEHQVDSGDTNQPLAMIPPLSSAPPNIPSSVPVTPMPALPLELPTCQSAPKLTAQPKSTTPIPPPSLPVTPRGPQSTSGLAASAKATPTIPKKTHIPAPRPWETLRKTQPPPPVSMAATPSPASMTPSPHMLPAYSLSENSRHLPQAGCQLNHVVQSAGSRVSPVQQPQPAATSLSPPVAVCHSPGVSYATGGQYPAISAGEQPAPVLFPTTGPLVAPNQANGTPDLPEVSDGSMELVESIIRNAQKASGFFTADYI
ncbi:hypothetical protein F5B22DRAFT_613703 [Xylaria bambusicola]|uniref:uncharacterized protein n=1 Tax=Xylaria bambusicola TaxID=326684 RepID=UPI0020083453|nr:uncharacterized protein F5B22DRAFT_613703 [Xylaria bambusicola]KAI0512909.1 hypothetical protein F5B22DRAFT_613703 [Xylaria bambusicola]